MAEYPHAKKQLGVEAPQMTGPAGLGLPGDIGLLLGGDLQQ
ncbi:hypothetical protein [Streptomyces pakalii]|uniref:Uncharacterized protein n=1 Tax=Streptomyces pakalii TaxID=3036494 RepID=A0ABT7DEA4_9ACTN|nr:hypothetical protein [Streptomyces pakalii]MDJ1644157.1 hypothetical protein [Streptomyces pakalii]